MRKKQRARKENRPSVVERISGSLGFPVSVLEGLPELSLIGNREAVVEHCQGVLEYNDRVIRLNTGRLTVRFTGRALRLRCMNDESVVVEGYFTAVEFVQ